MLSHGLAQSFWNLFILGSFPNLYVNKPLSCLSVYLKCPRGSRAVCNPHSGLYSVLLVGPTDSGWAPRRFHSFKVCYDIWKDILLFFLFSQFFGLLSCFLSFTALRSYTSLQNCLSREKVITCRVQGSTQEGCLLGLSDRGKLVQALGRWKG